jgi:predicted NAD-dependent protein-ADP-ribosyltransferase YbiA (DUF1768 family)
MAETDERSVGAKVLADPKLDDPEGAPPEAPKVEIPKQPYDKKQIEAIRSFFKKRTKLPGYYTFSKNGNLEIKEEKEKGAAGVIRLQRFVPLDPSERAAIEEARVTSLSEMDDAYELEMDTLRTAWEEYATTGAMRSVLASNQRLTEIDARRNAFRSAVRNLVSIPNPAVNEILLDQRYEERKMFGHKDPFDKEVVRLALYTFPAEVDQGKYVPDEEAVAETNEADAEQAAEKANGILYRQRLKDGRAARIFYDTDSEVNGFMSPMWVVDFNTNISGDIRYSSAIQAYEVERAKELGNDTMAQNILDTRSPRTIRLITRKVTGHPKDAKSLWVKIYTSIFEQHPILKAKLLETGSDTLVFADVREGPSGIGLSEKDSAALDPARWKGENAVGLALETVRTQMREGVVKEGAAAELAVGGTITEDEQKRAKVAAIINARRRR